MATKNFKVYKRGSIIYLDLGKGIGHEFSFKHFCLVITNKDNCRNSKLTVIPLTSKSKHSEKVNVSLLDHFLKDVRNKYNADKIELRKIQNKLKVLDRGDIKSLIELSHQITLLENSIIEYDVMKSKINNLINKSSYAKTKDIITISKNRILNYIKNLDTEIRLPKNETDRLVNLSFDNFIWIYSFIII